MSRVISFVVGFSALIAVFVDLGGWATTGGLRLSLKAQSGAERWYWADNPGHVAFGVFVELLMLLLAGWLIYGAIARLK